MDSNFHYRFNIDAYNGNIILYYTYDRFEDIKQRIGGIFQQIFSTVLNPSSSLGFRSGELIRVRHLKRFETYTKVGTTGLFVPAFDASALVLPYVGVKLPSHTV